VIAKYCCSKRAMLEVTEEFRKGKGRKAQHRRERIRLARRERIGTRIYLQLSLESCCERDLVEA
jgi:hypothetical protein